MSVASFRRYVAANLPEEASRSQVPGATSRMTKGEEAQIDYGQLGRWLDPATGKRAVVWAFAMVLCCSRPPVSVRPVLRLRPHAWTRMPAWRRSPSSAGCRPGRAQNPDNLKTGWDEPDPV